MSTDKAAAELPRLSLAEAVAKRIEARIAEEALPAGHRLGTRDSLRREFDVAAATFNETVRLLTARGTVTVRPGAKGGIFVASPPPLVRLGRKMLELSGDSVSVSDCLVMRDALEPLLAQEAMRHRTGADVADLRRLADEMAAARGSGDIVGYLAANWALHRRIAEITPNKVLHHTYVSLLEFVENRLRGVTPVSDGERDRPPGTPVLIPPVAASPSEQDPREEPTSAATKATLSPSPSPTSAKPTASPSAPSTKVDLTDPDDGDILFDGDNDFTAEGTVSDLGDNDLRIFIFDEDDATFYLADYGPEDVGGDGPWDIRSTGIGSDFGRDGDTYLVQVVVADPSCQRSLDGLELGNDRYPDFRDLPDGCRVGDQVRVEED